MTDLVPYQDKVLSSYDDVEKAARAMAGSGFFSDTRQASQAIVKILAAREIGLGPFAGMTGVNIIKGKPFVQKDNYGEGSFRSRTAYKNVFPEQLETVTPDKEGVGKKE